ncbi:MAG TPA: DUF3096 domain-containing protein [Candidatus Nanoarchaeia archaeon]|nr:DUF3096 domain-containing protein [Candidatus Nanoarchaeia archaeon]
MILSVTIIAMVTILFGILVLAFPNFLRLIVGLYFIISGLLMLLFNYL